MHSVLLHEQEASEGLDSSWMLQYVHPIMLRRILASVDTEKYKIDYNVLSVAAMTLGMIMMVEYMRHQLDHHAEHRPFFRVVLEGVYAELATLGFVEFFFHVIEEYHPSYDKTRKSVFADVHFLFFYTAILNAIFTVITAIFVTRISKQQWIQTETLELNHYVEIRETFARVQKKIDEIHSKKQRRNIYEGTSSTTNQQELEVSRVDDLERGSLQSLNNREKNLWSFQSLDQIWTSFVDQLRYPTLKHQYYTLLKQIRFHELRVHIIQSYNLPNQIKISDYLMRSEQMVLMKLVNISSLAWLLLTGAVCVMYYVFGMVFYKFENQELIGVSLTYIYFFWIAAFVVFCWMLSIKMKSIFNSLMHSEELWDVNSTNLKDKERLAQQQLALFWYKQPFLVVKLIQFMQFGYATSLSTLIVFWKDIKEGSVSMVWYQLSLIFCYILFVYVTAQAIPRFTLCTSLGQLVDERRLRETLALFRLEEAKQKELERLDDFNNSGRDNVDIVIEHDPEHFSKSDTNVVIESTDLNSQARQSHQTLRKTNAKTDNNNVVNGSFVRQQVKTDDRRRNTHKRKKSISDGVAMMARLATSSNDLENACDTAALHCSAPANLKAKELDASFQVLSHGDRMAELVKLDTSALRAALAEREQTFTGSRFVEKSKGRKERQQLHAESFNVTEQSASGAKSQGQHYPRKNSVSDGVLALSDGSSLKSGAYFSQPNLQVNDVAAPITPTSVLDNVKCDTATYNDLPVLSDDDCCSVSENVSNPATLKHITSNVESNSQAQGSNLMEWLHSYFFSERHIEISNVFGAIVVFFLVGHRVEGFIHSQEIFVSGFVSFNFDLEVTFWMLTAWLCTFVFVSFLIISLLWCYGDLQKTKGCRIATAAVIDSIISVTCLTMLLVAEHKRCCIGTLAVDLEEVTEKAGRSSFFDPEPIPCTCPRFGTRLYGGLGTIEPYTSLVLLRVFRHWFARKLLDLLQHKYGWPVRETEHCSKHEIGTGKQSSEVLKFGGRSWDVMNSSLIVTEVWEATIGACPDVAATHGEFSGEILRKMLGLSTPQGVALSCERDQIDIDTDGKGTLKKEDQALTSASSPMFSLNSQYSRLSPEAQALILAGKLGRSIVRSASQSNVPSSARPTLSRDQSIRFEIAKHGSSRINDHRQEDDTTNVVSQSYNFISPNARLIRSMRRCDRKFLPLLEDWTEVDVVATRFEIVYLDVTVDESHDCISRNGVRQALQATKGGKGLRLCDVVAGRRVAGRVVLTDISSLQVVRHLPFQNNSSLPTDNPPWEVGLNEYWKISPPSSTTSLPDSTQSLYQGRTEAWNHIKEDHLTIGTIHGHSLILRFYADLDDAIRHPEHLADDEKVTGNVFRNNAFQWVQTIGRLCGPEQLKKQKLPHFGDNSSNELCDYLAIIDRGDSRRGQSHRRLLSDGGGNSFPIQQSFRGLSRGLSRPNLIRRMSSLDTTFSNTGTQSSRGLSRPNLIRRMSSLDPTFSNTGTQGRFRHQFRSGPLHAPSTTSDILPGDGSSVGFVPVSRGSNISGNDSSSKGKKVTFFNDNDSSDLK